MDIGKFQSEFQRLAFYYIEDYMKQNEFETHFFLEPIADVHLNKPYRLDENIYVDGNIHGNKVYVLIFSIVGIFILAIGCANFMNLSTAKNINNFKETAIRKIIGGTKKVILTQFMIESIILSFIALNIALYMVELTQSSFNNLVGKQLNIEYVANWWMLPGLLLLGIVIGLLSGSYPAIYLSIVKPIDAFRNGKRKGSISSIIRKGLVVIQFAISIALIIASIVIYLQVDFMKSKELGFNKSNKIIIPVRGGISIQENYEELKKEFLSNSNIIDASVSSNSIGNGFGNYSSRIAREVDNKSQSMYFIFVDDDFINQYKIKLIAGRNFDNSIISDISSWEQRDNGSFLINESAVKSFGWSTPEEALGQKIVTGLGGRELKVIGVIKDFHFMGLQKKIEPLILEYFPNNLSVINLTINSKNVESSLKFIESKWTELYPDNPFFYYFLDDNFNKHYVEEEKAGKLVSFFTIFAIFIACLGLYGLTLYSIEQRTKEIGIRKVMGSSILSIIRTSSKGFIVLVLISNIVAWPLVYYYIDKWLDNFSYRIDISLWIFFVAGMITLLIAQATIGIQAVIAANKNPVDSLRYE